MDTGVLVLGLLLFGSGSWAQNSTVLTGYGGGLDVVIVLDGSNSINPWVTRTEFLKKLIASLDIGWDRTLVSVLQYSVDFQVDFRLGDFRTKGQVMTAAANIVQMYGPETNTFSAIQYACKFLFNETSGGRSSAPNIMVVVTDGQSHDISIRDTTIDTCEQNRVTRFGIADLAFYSRHNVSTQDLVNEVKSIASLPQLCFRAFDGATLSKISGTLGTYIRNIAEGQQQSGGPGRCSGSVEMLMGWSWSRVCGRDFGLTEAALACGELDCGAMTELQQVALFAEGPAVNRSFLCGGVETSVRECESPETQCSTAADLTCSEFLPVARASVSSEWESVSSVETPSPVQKVFMMWGTHFSVSCSLDEPHLPGKFLLLSPTGNHTLPDSAHFQYQAFSSTHIGNYTCIYCFSYHLLLTTYYNCSKSTTLYISPGVPASDLLIRAAIFVLSLLLWTITLFIYYKGCRVQRKAIRRARRMTTSAENNTVQMVTL